MLTLQKVMGMNVSSFGSWDKTSTTIAGSSCPEGLDARPGAWSDSG